MNTRISLTQGTTLTDVGGRQVLFSVKTGESFGLNDTAAHMLVLCMELGTQKAVEQLARDYEVSPEELTQDLHELLDGLKNARMIQLGG